jgi:type III secretion translocon protein HrpF
MTTTVQPVSPTSPAATTSTPVTSPSQGSTDSDKSAAFHTATSSSSKQQRQSQALADAESIAIIQKYRADSPELLDLNNLDALSKDTALPQELRDAYAHLRDSPALKKKLDGLTKDAALLDSLHMQMEQMGERPDVIARLEAANKTWADPNCATDGKASSLDLQRMLTDPSMEAGRAELAKLDADESSTASTLLKYAAYLPEKGLDLSRLDEYAQDDTLPPDLLKVITMMRDEPGLGERVAAKASGDASGFITAADLQAVQTAKAPEDAKAMRTIAAYRADSTEFLDFSKLDALANEATLPQELRDAYAHLRDNPDLLAKVDGATVAADQRDLAHDGLASTADLQAMQGDPALFDEWQKLNAQASTTVQDTIAQWRSGGLSDEDLQAKRGDPNLRDAWAEADANGSMPILKDKEAADLHAVSVLQAHIGDLHGNYLKPGEDHWFKKWDKEEQKISYDDLGAMSTDGSLSPDVQQAAAYLHGNPDLFNRLAGEDGELSSAELGAMNDGELQASSQKMAFSEGEVQTLRTLEGHMDRVPDGLGLGSLDQMANDESLPQDLRDAYAYMRDHPELTTRIDNAADHNAVDGLVGHSDLRAIFSDPRLVEANREQATVYTANFVSSDATEDYAVPHDITMGDACREIYLYSDSLPDTLDQAGLQKLVDKGADNKCPPQLRAAAQYLLDHPDDWAKLAPKGTVGRGELLNNVSQNINLRESEQAASDTVTSNPDQFTDGNGNITHDSLEATSKDTSKSQAVRDAATLMMTNTLLFGLMDNASKGYEAGRHNKTDDGVIGKDDIAAWKEKETKENRTPPPKPKPKPPTNRKEAQAQYDMMCGMQDDAAKKEVRGGRKNKLAAKILGIVGKVLDYAKMGLDVVAGFLPPPFGAMVAGVGMGLAFVNDFGIKAGAAIASGKSKAEAFKEAGKNFGMDTVGSLLSMVPGGGLAKAGQTAMRIGGGLTKTVATNAMEEGVKIGTKLALDTGKKVATEGAEFAAKNGTTTSFKQLGKDGSEFIQSKGLMNFSKSGDEVVEQGSTKGATSATKSAGKNADDPSDYWKLQGSGTKTLGKKADDAPTGSPKKADETGPNGKKKTEEEDPDGTFAQRQADEAKDAGRNAASEVTDAPVTALKDAADKQTMVLKEAADAQLAPVKGLVESEVKTAKASLLDLGKEQLKTLIATVPGGEKALELFGKGKALFTKGSAMKNEALEDGAELSASSGATTAGRVADVGEDGAARAKAIHEGRAVDEGAPAPKKGEDGTAPKKAGKEDEADAAAGKPKEKKKSDDKKTDDDKKPDDKKKKDNDDDKKKRKDDDDKKKREDDRKVAEALMQLMMINSMKAGEARKLAGTQRALAQAPVEAMAKQQAKDKAEDDARVTAEERATEKALALAEHKAELKAAMAEKVNAAPEHRVVPKQVDISRVV